MSSDSPKEPVLVVGCGSIGSRHLRNLAAMGIKRLLAYDADRQRCVKAAAAAGAIPLSSLEEAPPIEAAFICSPTSLHLEPARLALARGANLFIEKPISHSLDGVDKLLAKARTKERVVMVGFNLRFHPCLQRIKRLLDEGAIGAILGARIEFGQYLPDWHPWEDYRKGYSANRDLGGGIILDAVHEFDYARWLLGEIEAVSGMSGTVGSLGINTEDVAAFTLRHKGGTISEIHLDYLQRFYGRTCKVIGSEGTIYWDWNERVVRCYRVKTGKWKPFPEPDGYDVNDTYAKEIRVFFDSIRGKGVPPVDGETGARVLAVALAAKEAAATGRTVAL
jgi:predicted dehydrogenase